MGWKELNDTLNSWYDRSGLERVRKAIDPNRMFSPADVASFAPGGGIVNAWQDSGKGWQALKNRDWSGAAANYGNMALNMASEMPLAKLAVVPFGAAMRSGVPVRMPNDDVFRQAVANTKGAEITENGLTMAVARKQKIGQAGEESVRGGVFYLPEGSPNMRYYSGGETSYGGTEPIRGETLVNNPLFVKGATGGKAPETAYDQLMGKGAYQSMRKEALSAVNAYMLPRDQKIELIERFLEKHAPEMSGLGEHIFQNSQKGNQLAYALQEAAVGAAVRNAGHDAVVGYSKGKNGPSISELFDVRESHYPEPDGGYRVWPQYEGHK